ncbi:MAG: Kae1-associated kinase Bud32 [Candidatus Bathyarchaeia archaeon]|jgi:TP53 regulating kinase-like protein
MLTSPGEKKLAKLIYKGAEAEIYLQDWHGELAIRKSRIPKPYRVPELDESIRRTRTAHEANMMHEVRKLGVPVPTIQHIDPESTTIIMDYVPGPTLKEELYKLSISKRRERCNSLGNILGLMHEGGIVHGDMTISNVLSEDGNLYMIDFGLGDFSHELEGKGVDLLLLHRAMKSTHYSFHLVLFNAFLKGYGRAVGKKRAKETLLKMREVEKRGRYFDRA